MSSAGINNLFGSLSLNSTHKIIVGVDYGTTFTVIIDKWPGPNKISDTIGKTPSRIAYPFDNRSIGKVKWGFEIQPGLTAYSWTKLLLDEDTPLTKYDDHALEKASELGLLKLPGDKSAVDVASDFLSEVYSHILKIIEKQISAQTLAITPLEFWFTVPAIWSDKAKAATSTAARRAGFGTRLGDAIFMIAEPEAAAVAALKKTTVDGLGASVKPGDGVLVCDCGGGTVDITTYLINEVQPTLVFEELCTGIGGKCGSTAVDRNFYNLMSNRFGECFDNLPPKKKGPGSEFMNKFEIIKLDFGNDTDGTTHELPLRMEVIETNPAHYDDEECLVMINDGDLRAVFDPVVDQILELVRQQIKDANAETGKNTINKIILVGGFGDSEYLRRAFQKSFGSDGNILVTVPDRPQTAIVRGAALRGLEGLRSITKRCRRHYGYSWAVPFRANEHKEPESFIDPWSGLKLASGMMKWMIAKVATVSYGLRTSLMIYPSNAVFKGEKYAEDYHYEVNILRTHYQGENLRTELDLYSSDLSVAPKRRFNVGVRRVGKIEVDFTSVNLDSFPKKTIGGELAYSLKYTVRVIFGAKDGVLKFEARSDGRLIGTTSITYATAQHF
ncbi:conserved hypothetical protein [Uncinocarpus reesii 1704]|uniref:Actin-like ATPase domain-containing protein n=1 Tax=Uncinocarpus reesii (strain UAMH 1704) TaxID=336963 RepID=C4JL51_UNCRE|nr:uncharacterized protein UREG_00266 [Uncinocarpus reesii 1704]EEP75420.1 conserved hypothetical protein [Uncinocarpus reesii 1704]